MVSMHRIMSALVGVTVVALMLIVMFGWPYFVRTTTEYILSIW
ncbi:hypothetical protein L373_04201 [Klebsiella michiganensis]|uniref:Uncharacterized protein n=1 Tax=Klebsiella michiganensis TaxID=1134687 RepID=A0A7H5A4S6_9ENTR|nr:hypothetical protein HMPREF9686_00747 [Klebsiella michiganensis]EWF84169.1 hypothetical protein L373_04201 [Klebsiella michiganensis]SAQ54416.1 Uncharacterised protein [Klebsiella oxytoca]DAZ30510.1 MAG TPA: Cbb3-type cytochrome c oxidase subunit [Caudoviricetes sp.]